VWHLFLVTVGALGKAVALEKIVGAPGGSAFLGVSSFWIRHGIKSSRKTLSAFSLKTYRDRRLLSDKT
jgi:hypothetical protein